MLVVINHGISDKVIAMDDVPSSPPKFPVLTGISAGSWLVYGLIHAVLQAAALTGFDTKCPPSSFVCCVPISTLYMLAGVMTILGRMPGKATAEVLGIFIGFWELDIGIATLKSVPPAVSAVLIGAGIVLTLASLLSIYDIEAYNRWILARQRWHREHSDE